MNGPRSGAALGLTAQHLLLVSCLMAAARLAAAALAGLAPDETYYWLWSLHPAFGYYDHPPFVAWAIAVSSATFGNSALAIRLPSVLVITAVACVTAATARTLSGSAEAGHRAALWVNACLLVSVGGILATPDPLSVLMWALCLWTLARILCGGSGRWWLLFGLFFGLGVEAKYTGLFLGPGVLLWMAAEPKARRWLATPWPWAGALVAVAAIAPNLVWNAAHGWATLQKQFGRVGPSPLRYDFIAEFLGSVTGLLNPLLALFAALALAALVRRRAGPLAPALKLVFCLAAPLFAYMAVHVLHDRIQGNWPAPAYPGLVLAAALWAEHNGIAISRTWAGFAARSAAPVGIALSLAALAWLSVPETWMRNSPDPAQLTRGWDSLGEDVSRLAAQNGARWIAATDYAPAAALGWQLWRRYPVLGMVTRSRYSWRKAGDDAALGQSTAVIIASPDEAAGLGRCFENLRPQGPLYRPVASGGNREFMAFTGTLRAPGCDLE